MLRLLAFLWTGDWHLHRWSILEKKTCVNGQDERWTRFYLRCEECGKVKVVDP